MLKKALFLSALGLALILAVCNIWLGGLNLDEGWYLYAARAFARHGQLPYRDFFFTQAPLLPIVYGAFSWLWEPGGILGGRIFTAAIGLLAAAFAAGTAAAAAGRERRFECGLTVFLLLAGNVYHSYFTVIPKTYALASLMLMSGFFCLALQKEGRRGRNFLLAATGGFLIAGAAASRLSLGAVLAVTGFCMLADFRRSKSDWLAYGIGGLTGLALMIGAVAAQDFEAFKFANFFHGGRSGGGLILAAGSLSRLLRNYMPLFLLMTATLFIAICTRPRMKRLFDNSAVTWLLAFAAAFAVHLSSPFPYDDYQVPLIPLLACFISIIFWRILPASATPAAKMSLLGAILLCSAAFAFSSPLNETWVMLGKDRFWIEKKSEPDVIRLKKTAAMVRELSGNSKELFTTDTYLAVEAGMDVPQGLEMGPFGYFPGLSDEEAKRFHVANATLLAGITESTGAKVAAFSGYGLAIAAPAMTKIEEKDRAALFDIIGTKYASVTNVPHFGQEYTELSIWIRK